MKLHSITQLSADSLGCEDCYLVWEATRDGEAKAQEHQLEKHLHHFVESTFNRCEVCGIHVDEYIKTVNKAGR